jgi:hypothetical protein
MLELKMKNLILNNKAQISQTLTWIVATIIIVGILMVSIALSLVLANAKKIAGQQAGNVESRLEKNSLVLETKTSLAYELNNTNKREIETILERMNNEK